MSGADALPAAMVSTSARRILCSAAPVADDLRGA
jgi:hypothetical protein